MSKSSPLFKQLQSQKDLLSLLNEHHILGYCYQFIDGFEKVPQCQLQYKKQWIHNHTLLQVLDNLNISADKSNTQATLLKGIHLINTIYKDIGSRFMSDIDLLINSNDQNVWYELLTDAGFKIIESPNFYANDFKAEWTKTIGAVEVNLELHTRLFFYHYDEKWNLIPSHLSTFTILKSEDLFVHLCGHLAVQHNFLKLYWLMDIVELIKAEGEAFDWKLVKNIASRSNNLTAVQMCVWILHNYCDQKISSDIYQRLDLNHKKIWMKFLSVEYLVNPTNNLFIYFLIKHLTKDRLMIALRYDVEWFRDWFSKKRKSG